MPVDEQKINDGFGLVDEAEKLVSAGDFAKAIFKFQTALTLFDKSGLPPAKKRKVMDMVTDRQAEVARIQKLAREDPDAVQKLLSKSAPPQESPEESSPEVSFKPIKTVKTTPPPPPPIEVDFSSVGNTQVVDPQVAETEGLTALDEAHNLVTKRQYTEAIGKFYEAAEKLITAGWNESSLMDIQNEVHRISAILEQSAPSQTNAESEPDEVEELLSNVTLAPSTGMYKAPSVQSPSSTGRSANAEQVMSSSANRTSGSASPSAKASRNQSQPQEYAPTFAQVDQHGQPVKSAARSRTGQASQQEYAPTFAQLDQRGQPVKSTGKSKAGQAPQQEYAPTFAQLDQRGQPVKSAAKSKTGQTTQQEYAPTFSQLDQRGQPIKTAAKNTNSPAQPQEYAPTFSQLDQRGQPIKATAKKATGTAQPQEYAPTFTQLDQHGQAKTTTAKPMAKPAASQAYTPTFAQLEPTQGKSAPTKPATAKPAPAQAYTPTFAQLTSGGSESSGPKAVAKKQPASPYAPTFAQVSQKDFVPVNIAPTKSASSGLSSSATEAASSLVMSEDELRQSVSGILNTIKQQQDQIESMRSEAFNLIDESRPLEQDHKYQLAIEKLEDAIDMFNSMPGWAEEARPLFNYIHVLQEYLRNETKGVSPTDINMEPIQQEMISLSSDANEVYAVDEAPPFFMGDLNAQTLFEAKIQKEVEIQQQAFSLLEEGETSITENRTDDALAAYNKAILLLNSIGWNAQTHVIEAVITSLLNTKKKSEKALTDAPAVSVGEGLSNEEMKVALQKQFEARRKKIVDLEQEKARKEQLQVDAFAMVEEAEKAIKTHNYDEAYEKYRDAANMLISAGWQDQLAAINERILQLRQDRDQYIQKEQEAHRRMLEKQQSQLQLESQVQQMMEEKQAEMQQHQSTAAMIEEKRQEMEQAQSQIYQYLSDADNLLKKQEFDDAIAQYESAKELMNNIGWNGQLPTIDTMINNAESQKNAHIDAMAAVQAAQERVQAEQTKMQSYLQEQADLIAQEEDQKRKQIESFLKSKEKTEKAQNAAFKQLDAAEKLFKLNQFDDSIIEYQKAITLFTQIGWQTQIQSIQAQIDQVYEAQSRHEQMLTSAENARQSASLHQQAAAQEHETKQQQELQSLLDIRSMIKNVSAKREEETQLQDARKTERNQMRKELESWQTSSKSTLNALRNELRGSVDISKLDKIHEEEKQKAEKEAKDLADLRNLVRSATKKSSTKK